MFQFLRHLFRRRQPVLITLPEPHTAPLSLQDRTALRLWLRSPETKFALAIMHARHPGLRLSQIARVAKSEWDQAAAVNFLHRIQGWDAFRDGLLTIADDPAAPREVPETYQPE